MARREAILQITSALLAKKKTFFKPHFYLSLSLLEVKYRLQFQPQRSSDSSSWFTNNMTTNHQGAGESYFEHIPWPLTIGLREDTPTTQVREEAEARVPHDPAHRFSSIASWAFQPPSFLPVDLKILR